MDEDQRAKRVLELCDQALGLSAAERNQLLADECADDARLRASVDSVLIAVDDANRSFDDDDPLATDSTDYVGRQIGSYKILERLGKGGMGSVYLADRHEEGFDQRVAIKFVHSHMMAKELIQRFNAERQILAALNHPYIAALIDGGTTNDGIPYIVMEYVDGIPIDEYCDANKLDLRTRIKLIQKVAMAVQSAHQNLVVHRDLKPSNVLITPDGIPKLLDFGIAKLIQADDVDSSGNTTVFGRQAMTPDYASPEQILENKVTTASDVYTLGVLTYLLLVGERPYHIQTTSHLEMMKSVEGLTVPRPSTRLNTVASDDLKGDIADRRATTPNQLQRSLQGDLDNILLMALRQEPDRRYYSVAQFSDDLEKYLNGLPVIAREDSVRYRARKFLQRNWLAAGATVIIMLSLAVGLIGYASQAREAQRQRDIAQDEASRAENTVDFLRDMLYAGDPFATPENERTVDDVLKYAERNVSERYFDEPATRAMILTALADISSARADYERAKDLSAAALRLYADELGDVGGEAANAYRVNALAMRNLDDQENAIPLFEKSIELYTQAPEPDWDGLAQSYNEMAMTLGDLNRNDLAAKYFDLSLATYYDNNVDDPDQLIATLSNMGVENLNIAKFDLANKYLSDAIEIARTSGASDGQLGMLLANHAGALANLGRWDDAISNYAEAIDLMVKSAGPSHRETLIVMTSTAATHQQMGNLDKAEPVIRRAVAATEQALSPNQFVTSYTHNVAGSILCENGSPEEGMRYAQASLKSRREILPADHWAISSGAAIVGSCYVAAREFKVAEEILLQAHSAVSESLGDEHEVTVTTKRRIYDLYIAWKKPEEAEKWAVASD